MAENPLIIPTQTEVKSQGENKVQFNGVLWLRLILATLLGFFLIQRGKIPTAKGSGIALISFVIATLAYASYQVITNFRQNDLTAIAILILILSGIACIKRARSLQIWDIGISLLHLAGLLTIYMIYIIILAVFLHST